MQVILLEKVQNLGSLGDTVVVAPGFARNYLVPAGKAVSATPENLAAFEERRAELERHQNDALAAAEARAAQFVDLAVTVTRKAGDEGRLFGSVTAADIAEAATAAGAELHKQEVRLNDTIRATGDFDVELRLHTDIECTIRVTVAAEG